MAWGKPEWREKWQLGFLREVLKWCNPACKASSVVSLWFLFLSVLKIPFLSRACVFSSLSPVPTPRCHISPSLSPQGLWVPAVLENAIVLLSWRRQDRLRVRSQVCGDVEKVRQWLPSFSVDCWCTGSQEAHTIWEQWRPLAAMAEAAWRSWLSWRFPFQFWTGIIDHKGPPESSCCSDTVFERKHPFSVLLHETERSSSGACNTGCTLSCVLHALVFRHAAVLKHEPPEERADLASGSSSWLNYSWMRGCCRHLHYLPVATITCNPCNQQTAIWMYYNTHTLVLLRETVTNRSSCFLEC